MQKKIDLDISTAQKALDLLFRIDMIRKNASGKFVEAYSNTSYIAEGTTTEALKNLQIELLEKSIESIQNDDFCKRDHSSLTLAVNSSRLNEAIELTKKYRKDLCKLMQKENKKADSVCQLCVSFYPLTKN